MAKKKKAVKTKKTKTRKAIKTVKKKAAKKKRARKPRNPAEGIGIDPRDGTPMTPRLRGRMKRS